MRDKLSGNVFWGMWAGPWSCLGCPGWSLGACFDASRGLLRVLEDPWGSFGSRGVLGRALSGS